MDQDVSALDIITSPAGQVSLSNVFGGFMLAL